MLPLLPLYHMNANSSFLFMFVLLFLPIAHSFSFNLTSFDPDASNIICEGDATVSSGAIELNRVDYLCRVGRAVYADPIPLWDSSTMALADFTTHFSFIIDTQNASYYGNGIAFFLAPVGYPIPPNSAGGFLGLLNSTTRVATSQNHIIMVEFDSYFNADWDPPFEHVGINSNSLTSLVHAPWHAGSNSGKLANVWITYNASTKNLSVFWTYDENPVFMGNSSLSRHIDLTKTLPEWVTIGFSAGTGEFTEYNTIKSWDFTSNLDTVGKKLSHSKKKSRTYVVMLVPVSFVFLVLGLVTGWLQLKRRYGKNVAQNGHANGVHSYTSVYSDLEGGGLPRNFSYQELLRATKGFANDGRLGQGGSAHVYKGTLDDQRLVAVKRIFAESKGFFINELKIISRLIHRNLVRFIGWCHDQNELLLVYEYMPNGCLESHLHGNKPTLPWDVRYKIAMELASALHYLHEGAEPCVLHRDIKSANVLLDTDFTTKLGDFGVAKLVDQRLRTQTTMVVGTPGYLAPEYMQEQRARKETDMYSFGIVALEIATGRKPNQNGGLLRWVWQLYIAGNILDATDGRLTTFYENEMECLLMVGLWCTHPNDRERPNAEQAIKVLQREAPLPELPHDMHDHPAPLPPLHIDT
ncbi:hypothetical protein REPUB_Repub06bG0146200 [Reevesia pubescens]